MLPFYPSRKAQEQQQITEGARDRRSTLGNLVGTTQHSRNLRREYGKLREQKRSERRRMRESWRLREKEHRRELRRREEHYTVKYDVNDYEKGSPERKRAEEAATKWFEKDKRERERKLKEAKREAERELDLKYRRLRKDVSDNLREQYRQAMGRESNARRLAA